MFRIQHIPSGTLRITAREAGAAACLLVLGSPSELTELLPHPCLSSLFLTPLEDFFRSSRLLSNSNNAKFPLLHAFLFWLFPPMVDLHVVC